MNDTDMNDTDMNDTDMTREQTESGAGIESGAGAGAASAAAAASWFERLRGGLARSSARLTDGINTLFATGEVDDATLEELEDLLIMADLGPETAHRLAEELRRTRFGRQVTPEEVKTFLAEECAEILRPVAAPLPTSRKRRPNVLMMVGVNGSGKTTTMGKLARQLVDAGKSVTLVAGDTFRAAAVEQLQIWGERAGCPVIAGDHGSDAAALAYDAVKAAQADGTELVMIDTAGRLQNKANLMAELQKIARVVAKLDPDAPHATLLVLDATTGQNAFSQLETFKEMAHVSGLVITKLDGSAKGGVTIGLAERFGLPIHAVGVGEGIGDLRPFRPRDFGRSLMGLEREAQGR